MTDEENAANAELLRWAKVAYDVLSEIHAQYLPEDGDSPLLKGLGGAIERAERAKANAKVDSDFSLRGWIESRKREVEEA